MANEILVEGRAYTGVELESTYGSAPSPDVTFPGDEVFFRSFTPTQGAEDLPRRGHSPYQIGLKGSQGKETYGFGCTFELTGFALDSSTCDPRWWDLFLAMGWGAFTGYSGDGAGGSADTIYSDYNPIAPGSVSVIHREEEEGGADGIAWTYRGCRGSGTIRIPAAGDVTVDANFLASSLSVADYATSIPALAYADSEGDTRLPLVNRNTTFVFAVHESGGASYGGKFVSAEINLNGNPVATTVGSSSSGIGRVILAADGPVTGNLVIEATNKTSFDIYAHKAANKPMHASIQLVPPDGSSEVIYLDWFCRIVSIAESFEDSRKVWTVAWESISEDTGTRLPATESYNYDAGDTAGTSLRLAIKNTA